MFARSLLLVALVAPSFAYADDPLADDDEELFKDNSEKKAATAGPSAANFQDEDDIVIPVDKPKPPTPAKAAAPAGPQRGVGLDVTSAKPFADNWAPTISIIDKDAVVVDMPVLYGSGKASYAGKDTWLIAEVYADGKRVAESRAFITKDSIGDQGSSVQFFRLYSPVTGVTGVLEVKVSRLVTGATKNELLFTRSVPYTL